MARRKNVLEYPRALVKRANERLRKLEKVYTDFAGEPYAVHSRAYEATARKAYDEYNRNGGQSRLFRISDRGDSIRFANKTTFDTFTEAEKEKYINYVKSFMESKTSTRIGYEDARDKAFNTFKENNEQFQNMTREEYDKYWKIYNDQIRGQNGDHFGSGTENFDIFLARYDTLEMLRADQLETAMNYAAAGRWTDLNYLETAIMFN